MKNHLRYFVFLIPILIFACAKQVTLTGGTKDEVPPVIKSSMPELGATNFKSKTILLKFNEYIKLNNVQQNLIVSPPMERNPTIKLSGKSIKIVIDTSILKKNTTYTLNFSEVIGDENENNLINSFVYSFSTGDKLDSLSVGGILYNIETQKPEPDVTVLLHSNFSDSAFYNTIPDYVSKTDKNGNFLIPNIAEKQYNIFALKDINRNYKFDLPTEKIAFLDSVIMPFVEFSTLGKDTDDSISDTIKNDTVQTKKLIKFKPDNLKLYLFEENKQKQFVKSYKRLFDNYLELVFNSKQYEKFSLKVAGDNNAIVYAVEQSDTILIWTNNIVENKDSITVFLEYIDPIFLIENFDTLKFKKAENKFNDTIEIFKIISDKFVINKFKIGAKYPIAFFDISKISLQIDDTTNTKIQFSLQKDSLDMRNLLLIADWEQGTKYKLLLDTAAIIDIFGLTSNKVELPFKTQLSTDFSELKIKISRQGNFLVQLLKNDKVEYLQYTENQNVEFKNVLPGSYQIKFIEDKNNNKRWDTGDYSKKIQPEPIMFYPNNYELKKNFLHEIEF